MRAKLVSAGLLALAWTSTPVIAEPAAGALDGDWKTASGNLIIEIVPCEDYVCGDVIEVLANRSMSGMGESAAPPAEVGLRLLSQVEPRGQRGWKGKIYNRVNGKTYKCNLSILEDGSLKVRAYVGLSLFGQTQVWTRPAVETAG